ncbi:hypothetical protein KY366_06960 [Candidatus Woesearchaeota archaeon]|nr:hypothetical protein [Candidatus Woesearchaeota archaeon]
MELREIDPSKLPEEIADFAPIGCMDCGFEGYIPRKLFLVKPEVTNEKEYAELRLLLKNKFGYNSFSECHCELGMIVSVSKCPKCGSESIFKDF